MLVQHPNINAIKPVFEQGESYPQSHSQNQNQNQQPALTQDNHPNQHPKSRNPDIRNQLPPPTSHPQEFGSNVLMIRKKRSHASIRGSPVRQFFLRLFRRSRTSLLSRKSSIRRRPSKRISSSNNSRHPFSLFNLKSHRTEKHVAAPPAISSPLQVTKYVGIDPTGSPELLSIKSHHSSGALRIHAISGKPVSDNTSPASRLASTPFSTNDSQQSLQLGSHLNRYRNSHTTSQNTPNEPCFPQTDLDNFDQFSDIGAGVTGYVHSRGPSNTTSKNVPAVIPTAEKPQSPSGIDGLDALDLRLEMLQRDLDEARRIKRRMTGSTRRLKKPALPDTQQLSPKGSLKRSISSSKSSLYRRPSAAKARSIISIASSIASISNPSLAGDLKTPTNLLRHASNASSSSSSSYHPNLYRSRSRHYSKLHPPNYVARQLSDNAIKRSDILPSRSFNHGIQTEPISEKELERLDKENSNVRVDEALAFVDTWSSYLRRAIAVRIVLRKEMQEAEQQKLKREHQVWEDIGTKKYSQRKTYPPTQQLHRSQSDRNSVPTYYYDRSQTRRAATTDAVPARRGQHPALPPNKSSLSRKQPVRALEDIEDEESESNSGDSPSVSSFHSNRSSNHSDSAGNRTSGHSSTFAAAHAAKQSFQASKDSAKDPSTSSQPHHSATANLACNQSVSFQEPSDTSSRRFTIATTLPSLDSEYGNFRRDEFRGAIKSFEADSLASPSVGNESTHSPSLSKTRQPVTKVHPLHPHSQDIGALYSQHAIRKPSQSKRVRRFRSTASLSDGDDSDVFEDAASSHSSVGSALSKHVLHKRSPSSIRRSIKNGDIETRYSALMSPSLSSRNDSNNSSSISLSASDNLNDSFSSPKSPGLLRQPLQQAEKRTVSGSSVKHVQVVPVYITKNPKNSSVSGADATQFGDSDSDKSSASVLGPLPEIAPRPQLHRNRSSASTDSSASSAAQTTSSTETFSTPGKETLWMRGGTIPATANSFSKPSDPKTATHINSPQTDLLAPSFTTQLPNHSFDSSKLPSPTVRFPQNTGDHTSSSLFSTNYGEGMSHTLSETISVDDRSAFNGSLVSISDSISVSETSGRNRGTGVSSLASVIQHFSASGILSTASLEVSGTAGPNIGPAGQSTDLATATAPASRIHTVKPAKGLETGQGILDKSLSQIPTSSALHSSSPNVYQSHHADVSKNASTSSVASGGSSDASSTHGIPKLLRDQREISDRILEDMVKEMEELEQRSTFLLAKSQRQFTKLSGDEGVFGSSGQPPMTGQNLSSNTLSLKEASPMLHGTKFAPGFIRVPSSSSGSDSSSAPVSEEETIPLVAATQHAGFAGLSTSPSDQTSSSSGVDSNSSSGNGSVASAVHLQYSMRRSPVNSTGTISRPGSVVSTSAPFQQSQYYNQHIEINTHVLLSSGEPVDAITADTLAPIPVNSPPVSSAPDHKIKFATTAFGGIPIPERPIGSPEHMRPEILSFSQGGLELYTRDGQQPATDARYFADHDEESDEDAKIIGIENMRPASPIKGGKAQALAPTTGTRMSTVAEVTETSSLGSSGEVSDSSSSLPHNLEDRGLQGFRAQGEDDVHITKVSRSSSSASSSSYSSTHYSDNSSNLTPLHPKGGIALMSLRGSGSIGQPVGLRNKPHEGFFRKQQEEVRDVKGKGIVRPSSNEQHPQTSSLEDQKRYSQSSESSDGAESQDSSQFSVVLPMNPSKQQMHGTSTEYILDSPTASSFTDLPQTVSKNKERSSSVSSGFVDTNDLHYKPGFVSSSPNHSVSVNSLVGGSRSRSTSMHSLVPRESTSPVPRHIPTDNDTVISAAAATITAFSSTSSFGCEGSSGNSGSSALSRGKLNRRRATPSKRHSLEHVASDSHSETASPNDRCLYDQLGRQATGTDFDEVGQAAMSSNESILPLPPVIVPGALPLYVNRNSLSSSSSDATSNPQLATTPVCGTSPSNLTPGTSSSGNHYSTPSQGSPASSLVSRDADSLSSDDGAPHHARFVPTAGVSAVSAAAAANAAAINASNFTGITSSGSFYSIASLHDNGFETGVPEPESEPIVAAQNDISTKDF